MAEYRLPNILRANPHVGVINNAPMLVKLPTSDFSKVVRGQDKTVLFDSKFSMLYDGQAYTNPMRAMRPDTEKRFCCIVYYIRI